MYNLPYFKEKDQQKVLAFMQEHPFAFITGCTSDGRPVATQVPLFVKEREGKLFLTGHLMKGTDHHKAFLENGQVLCVFTGPHTYVSATWYTNPHQASTWNYMSVHVRGVMHYADEESLKEVLRETSLHFEGNNHDSSTSFDNLPEEYTAKLLKAIVAFEIEVESVENVFKLSQNHSHENYGRIIEKLEARGGESAAVAEEMKKREQDLFGQKEQ
jgi:transcriptional regulator